MDNLTQQPAAEGSSEPSRSSSPARPVEKLPDATPHTRAHDSRPSGVAVQ